MTRHIMLDLETWGKTPGCDIRSIGAVVFDPTSGFVAGADAPALPNNQFYIATDNPSELIIGATGEHRSLEHLENADEYRKYPLTRDPETVQWWNDQSEEAQAAFANPVDLRDACERFTNWIDQVLPGGTVLTADDGYGLRLWANDPHFDVSILDAVYRAVGLPVPWHYRAPRSMKTVCDLANITREDMKQFNHGTAHNALDDAISQAMIVCEAYKRLGLKK